MDMDMFRHAAKESKNPLCYNGDLFTTDACEKIAAEFPQLEAMMLGRGLVADPGRLMPGGTDISVLEKFFDTLLEEYIILFGGSRNAMFRLKENWGFIHSRFEGCDKLWKQLRKTTDLGEYKRITGEIFHTLPLK